MLIKKCPDCKTPLSEVKQMENKQILKCDLCGDEFTLSTGKPYIHFTGKTRLKVN